jgi:pimeloyl-ACP methyl ester carboxylesterase
MSDAGYIPDGSRRGVLVCHSAGQRHYDQSLAQWWPVPRALAQSGMFACLACDFGDGDVEAGETSGPYSWGNENSIARMSDAYRFLNEPRVGTKAGGVLVVGSSMGALVGLNWTLRHRALVRGVLLGCPVLDLAAAYDAGRSALAETVAAAYGVNPPSAIPRSALHSPVSYAPDLAGVPIRIYASRDDPVASDTEACRRFAESVGGDLVEVVDLGAAGHWPVSTPVEDALSFAMRLA